MATIKDFEIKRNFGTRPDGNVNIVGSIWAVNKGEDYDLVQFSINELDKPYKWWQSLCCPCGSTEEEIKITLGYIAKEITEKDIKEYKRFLEDGEEWGWD